ncbi:UNVERIFIED_ORG: glycosyltransferase involved in cell wall biosynthesis [Zoogloea ramigera]|uniref:Glycosyltransferase family 4 protein n=1 Tax=Duganella zoogloeoides TaxID=75659 RepID=A0ABZ0XUP4_9BURK|nr:glycosyltransferase family 4 protein [Duganella zoogloeoides]WQH03248.1 glycosyltransferase family 4 protein [Duganella zoogloeoides]
MKIAYLINQYPKVSHSFIRREILALERQGFEVERFALRGWADQLVDAEDLREREKTRYLLRDGAPALVKAMLGELVRAPGSFLGAAKLALRMARRADRPLPLHLIYLAEACRMLGWMRKSGVRHLHAHFGTNPAEVAMLARALGGPAYSFTVHGPEEFDKPEFLHIKEKIARSAFVVAISSFGRSQLFRWIPYTDWPKVEIVHCGLEPAFHAGPAVPPPAAPRLVCVGRLCEQKGQLLLVRAVAQLVARGVAVELVLAGDGEMRSEIETLIARHQLHNVVRITGWISSDQVREEILASRALALPSFAEGLPVVVMESMTLRRPVLTTYVAGIPELVRDGENGWLIPAGDVDAVAAGLERVLATPLDQIAIMGERAHLRAVERHSIDTEAAKLAVLIKRGQ